jgi:hypothetical protein
MLASRIAALTNIPPGRRGFFRRTPKIIPLREV